MEIDRVTIVVDDAFGEKAADQAVLGPVWVVRSPINESAIERLRVQSTFPPDHLTIFDDVAPTDSLVYSMLDTVDEHHFGWTKLEVIGVPPSPALEKALGNYGPGDIQETANGFVFSRQLPPD